MALPLSSTVHAGSHENTRVESSGRDGSAMRVAASTPKKVVTLSGVVTRHHEPRASSVHSSTRAKSRSTRGRYRRTRYDDAAGTHGSHSLPSHVAAGTRSSRPWK